MALRRPLVLFLAALALALAPASASAAWPARTVATGGAAFALDVDGLPGGAVATLLERHVRGTSRLELWIGRRHTLIAASASAHSFGGTLGHDARGRVVVAWETIPDGGSGHIRQGYVWTAARGVERLTHGTRSVTTVDVAVAPDGRAAVSVIGGARIVVVARGTTTGGFDAPEAVEADVSFPAPVGIAEDGTVTVAWRADAAVGLARAAWGRPFGTPVEVAVPHLDGLELADTRSGLAVVAVKQTARQLTGDYTRDVSVIAWEPDAAAPLAPVRVSQGQVGSPAAVAVGDRAFVVWRQARTTRTAPSALGVAVLARGAAAAPAVRVTVPGRGGAGGPLGSVFLAPSGSGVRPYFGVGGAIHTAHVDASGRLSGTTTALGPAEGRPFPAVADANGPVAVWTRQTSRGRAGFRVRIARP